MRDRNCSRRWSNGPALCAFLILAFPVALRAQGTEWSEATVGSDWELYTRALAVRGMLGDETWAIRPFSPPVMRSMSASISGPNPWKARLPQYVVPNKYLTLIRPSVEVTDNTAYAWGFNDGPAWQGRGLSSWATVGAEWRLGPLSGRFEPMAEYAQNQDFQLQVPSQLAANPFVNAMRPNSIDEPQRYGNGPYRLLNPGNSNIRLDVSKVGLGFSTEDIFWGPGIQNAILFDNNASGFPHIFFGTNSGVHTPIGRISGQVIYGRLEQSDYAPPSPAKSRLGAGYIVTWQPPTQPLTIGFARFYHRDWPTTFSKSDYTLPFGALLSSRASNSSDVPDNQLLSVFFSARAPKAGFELFGEFGKNDRNSTTRDLTVELEHNSAWLLGFLKVINLDSAHTAFWTVRAEVANGRIAAIQQIGRVQATFYEHVPIAQGHTELGQLLGTPLMDQSGGVNMAVDRWNSRGRFGATLFERQMPLDKGVGMPADDARSQWDLGVGGTIFIGPSDLTFQTGYVWDLNRFPGDNARNAYVRITTRIGGL